jgi:hypothetical protein
MVKCLIITIALSLFVLEMQGQDSITIKGIPKGYLDQVSAKSGKLEQKLDRNTEKALRQIVKHEAKMKRKLAKMDSIAAGSIFSNTSEKYKRLQQKLKTPEKLTHYLPKLDTLATSLKFLESNPQLLSSITDAKEKLKKITGKVNGIENQLQKAEEIKRFLQERKQYLKEQLNRFGFAKELKKMNKQAWYYNQQVNEYREILKDSRRVERKAIELLSKTRLFRDFMKKNSLFASMFPVAGAGFNGQSSQPGFAGLQTRSQLSALLQQTGMGGSNMMSQFQQNIQSAESQLSQLRNKLSQVTGAGGNDLEMPDFKPNSQKTKSFFKRLEYGTTIQSQKANGVFPSTSDVGLSVGYKLDDKSIIGLGASYKIGLGKGWNNIRLTNQGVGLRSFIDWKIKGAFWVSGGYEQNYRTIFNSVEQLKDLNAWQQSGLLGISKIVSLKSKFLKKTKLQLYFDFLSFQQIPKTQPLLFRLGYSF